MCRDFQRKHTYVCLLKDDIRNNVFIYRYDPHELVLTGDFNFGAHDQFINEARMAVRLANFISAFLQVMSYIIPLYWANVNINNCLQVSDPKEVYSGKRVADKPLSEDQMIGETLALVLGNSKIWSAGTYWQRNKFTNRTLFAPYAYKTELNTRKFKVEDLARLNTSGNRNVQVTDNNFLLLVFVI